MKYPVAADAYKRKCVSVQSVFFRPPALAHLVPEPLLTSTYSLEPPQVQPILL